ncbi:MAG: NAD(P)/FAD-dependent oxidoreductase [Clostridia bacterium]
MTAAVIGGGAAGLTAAIFAKRTNPAAEIVVFEGNDRVGKKILATGNGRCNVSNTHISAENYTTHNSGFVKTALTGHGFGFVRDFFGSLGIPLVTEEGRAYPRSMRAGAVADALRFECVRLGIELRTGTRVRNVSYRGGKFDIDGQEFRRLILACGGKAAPSMGTDGFGFDLARELGHKVYSTYPALVQLRTENGEKALKGIRARAKASAIIKGKCVREETGEIQFCDYGLSGIPILQLSSLFNGNMEIELDLFPDMEFTPAVEYLLSMAERTGDLPLPDFMGGFFHKNLTRRICAQCSVDPDKPADSLTVREIKQFVGGAKALKFNVVGTNSWTNAQTTRGGVDLSEIVPETMQSKILGGLYFAGEVTDVCGDCGGYNLHWAWVSGARAGTAAVCK